MDLFLLYSAITKAVETAINSRQWAKAVQILELQDSALASRYYKKIADHYASIGEYEVKRFEPAQGFCSLNIVEEPSLRPDRASALSGQSLHCSHIKYGGDWGKIDH